VVRRLHIPIVMIPNGIEVGAARWTGGGDRVVVMGGRGGRKGEELAIDAWSRLPASLRNGLRLDVIGVEPAARRDTLRALAARFGVKDQVSLEGTMPRDAYLERIAGGLLAVSCSRLEAFGLPVAEALVLGAPVIASDIPSHRELMARAGAGDSFPSGNADALARRLAQALRGNLPEQLRGSPFGWSWRERARQHIDAYHEPGPVSV
jgi:glycosyltransferase involved in cell wall biosynthesis